MNILTPQQLQNILAYLSLEYGNLTIDEIAKQVKTDVWAGATKKDQLRTSILVSRLRKIN